MKKITLLVAFFLAVVTGSYAQVSSYSFAQNVEAYTEITGGTVLGTTTSDDQRFVTTVTPAGGTATTGIGFPIGFNFTFNGVVYDRVAINNNGWICLGQSALTPSVNITSTSSYLPLSSAAAIAPTQLRARIAGLGFDLQGQVGSELRIQTIGATPNQTLVVQWKGYRRYNQTGSLLNFQIRLNETSNVVNVTYGATTFISDTSTAQVGLGGAANTDFNNRITTTDWNVTNAGIVNTAACAATNTTVVPASGRTFSWTPPVPCAGTPIAGSVAPAIQNICATTIPANLVATGYTSGVTGLTFQWEESNDNGVSDVWAPAVAGAGATTAIYTPPAFSGITIYYRLNVTCTNGGASAQTASVSVNPPANPTIQITGVTIPAATVGYAQANITWIIGNGTRRAVFISDSATFADPVNGNAAALTPNTVYAGSGQQLIFDNTGAGVTVTGLSGSTTYYIKAYEYTRCGAGPYDYYYNTTTGTNIATFATCGALTVPTLEPFATFLPGCWQEADNGDLTAGPATFGASDWSADGLGNVGTTGAIDINVYQLSVLNDWIISPIYTIPATGYELKFDAAAVQFNATTAPTTPWEADDTLEVLVSTTGTDNWTVLDTFNDANQPANTATSYIYDLSAYNGQNIRIAFRALEGATDGAADIEFSIDNFEIRLTPACIQPVGLTSSAVAATTATVSWGAVVPTPTTGYEYVVSTSNVAPTGAGIATTAITANLTLLTAQTTYYLFVRSDCGSGSFSTWSGPTTFTTACGASTVPTLEPFATFLPSPCWQLADGGDITAGPATFGASDWSADGLGNVGTTGAIDINVYQLSVLNDWIISPTYAIPATGYELKFDAAAVQYAGTTAPTTPWEADDTIEVLVSTTGTDNWTVLDTFNDANQPANTATSYIYDLSAYNGQNIRIAFRALEGATGGAADIEFSIDNFEIRLTPACVEPTSLVVSNLTSVSADIAWTGTGNFQYVLDNVATNPTGAGTPIAVATYSATLMPSTVYYFHVRTDCGGIFSIWSTIMFTTPAAPPVNDDCTGATVLAPAVDFATGSIVGTIVGATATAGVPAPTCASYVGGDVWYSVTVPASGNITIEIGQEAGGFTDSGLSVYSGTCASLVEIDCNDDFTGNFSLLAITGRTPGEVLYARAWRFNSALPRGINAIGEFRIAAYDAALSTSSFNLDGFSAYPNPVKDVLNLSYTKQISNVSVYTILGQEVMTKVINATQSKVDMSNLSNGTYFVKVTVDGLVNTIKVLKQ